MGSVCLPIEVTPVVVLLMSPTLNKQTFVYVLRCSSICSSICSSRISQTTNNSVRCCYAIGPKVMQARLTLCLRRSIMKKKTIYSKDIHSIKIMMVKMIYIYILERESSSTSLVSKNSNGNLDSCQKIVS